MKQKLEEAAASGQVSLGLKEDLEAAMKKKLEEAKAQISLSL